MKMNKVIMFIKESGYGTGVTVSSNHLLNNLKKEKIEASITYYFDDSDLIQKFVASKSNLYILQVPSFSNDTLKLLLNTKRKILLATHSTICNLQTEGDLLSRLLDISSWNYSNLFISCPSETEVNSFNSFSKIKFYYLPNTYSYNFTDAEIVGLINKRVNEIVPLKISIFCAIRSFKNIFTQMAAVSLLAKKIPNIELHLLSGNDYLSDCIDKMGSLFKFKVVRHPSCSNQELLKIISEMHIGMQVSLTETFSYVAFEHMCMGVPTLGSSSVPYATKVVDYSNAEEMASEMFGMIKNKQEYEKLCTSALNDAKIIRKNINNDAVKLIKMLLQK